MYHAFSITEKMLIIETTLADMNWILDALNHALKFCFEGDIYEWIRIVIKKHSELLNQGKMFLDCLTRKIRSKNKFPNLQ